MRTLVIGGAASGKSEWAEQAAMTGRQPLFYLATMLPYGPGSLARIKRHRRQRAEKGFVTVEQAVNLASLTLPLPERGTVLLECLGNLVANELFSPGGAGDATIESVLKGIMHLESQCHQLLVVSNDVFADGILYPDGTQHYISVLASLHAQLAGRFERVIEVVCGIPLQLKPETTKEVVTV